MKTLPGQTDVKRRWKAMVVEIQSGQNVTEYEVTPKHRGKLYLTEMLDAIHQVVTAVCDEQTIDVGIMIW